MCWNNYVYTKWALYSKWCFSIRNKSAQCWLRPLHSAYCSHRTVVKTGVGQHVHHQRSKLGLELFPGLARLQAMWCNGNGLFCNVVKNTSNIQSKSKTYIHNFTFFKLGYTSRSLYLPKLTRLSMLEVCYLHQWVSFSNNQIRTWIKLDFTIVWLAHFVTYFTRYDEPLKISVFSSTYKIRFSSTMLESFNRVIKIRGPYTEPRGAL